LQDYERQTGIVLVKHPLAKLLVDCDSVKSVVGVLRKGATAFGGDGGRIVKALEGVVSVLHRNCPSQVVFVSHRKKTERKFRLDIYDSY